jgi:hypothetical protein
LLHRLGAATENAVFSSAVLIILALGRRGKALVRSMKEGIRQKAPQ